MEDWFGNNLIKWYEANKRHLPWRDENDAYKIWLSEIILQQTQVVQGLAYYLTFAKKYPNVRSLANANEDEVLKLWQGLGYYSRARNLHAAAKHITEFHSGKFPNTYEEIKKLKGVGDYTAAAISSFAYNLPYAVVDGNVYRLLSRVFGIETPIDSSAAKKQFQELANQLLDKKKPGLHNQAIMEFGSQYCKPVNPNCQGCIFNNKCWAFENGLVAVLPIKSKKTKVRNRYFNYLVVVDKNNHVLISKRSESDIWQALYEFILFETPSQLAMEDIIALKQVNKLIGNKPTVKFVSQLYKHILSHQHLYAKFIVLQVNVFKKNEYLSVAIPQLKKYAFPRLIEKFLNDCNLKEII